MKLYHIHRHNKYDDKFYEGNIILSGEMINCMRERYLSRCHVYLDLLKFYSLKVRMEEKYGSTSIRTF